MLYVYNIWSKDGMRIIDRNYVMVCADEVTIKRLIEDNEPDSISKFFELLRGIDIKYEMMVPISFDTLGISDK